MTKTIEIYVYDNGLNEGIVQDHHIRDYDGGDCAKMTVELPEGWECYTNVCGDTVLDAPDGLDYLVYEAIREKHGMPYIGNKALKVLSSERVSCALYLNKEED